MEERRTFDVADCREELGIAGAVPACFGQQASGSREVLLAQRDKRLAQQRPPSQRGNLPRRLKLLNCLGEISTLGRHPTQEELAYLVFVSGSSLSTQFGLEPFVAGFPIHIAAAGPERVRRSRSRSS